MANVKKGVLTAAGEWWKHLRWTKRAFWKGERQAGKSLAEEESQRQIKDLTLPASKTTEVTAPNEPEPKKAEPELEWVEITMAEFAAKEDDLVQEIHGDGHDKNGRPTSITRYRCKRTGTIYEIVYEAGANSVWRLRPTKAQGD